MKALQAAVVGVLLAALLVTANASAEGGKPHAANANGNKLQCFSGTEDNAMLYGGDCYFEGNNAVVNTTTAGAEGSYAGVYIQNSNLGGKLVSDVNKLAFSYDGSGATGGSPRLSVPVDNNKDGKWDAFLFVDTTGCNDGDANKGTLDAVNDTTCTITLGDAQYANWSEFVAANPDLRIAKDTVSFVIVDQPGEFTLSNVQLGKGPAKPGRD